MKKILLSILALGSVLLLWVTGVAPLCQPLHYRIASDLGIRGKGKDGQCEDYAIALSCALARNDIHGRLIHYRWHIRGTDISGSHVLVLYRYPDETEWIVDNERPHPKRVAKGTPLLELVYQLSDNIGRDRVDVELVDSLNELSFF